MPTCPRCGKAKNVRLSHAEGFWEERVLRLVGWFPFRCRSCGHRFHRRGSSADRARKRKRAAKGRGTIESFRLAEPAEPFEEVIEVLKRAEAQAELEAEHDRDQGPDNVREMSRNRLR